MHTMPPARLLQLALSLTEFVNICIFFSCVQCSPQWPWPLVVIMSELSIRVGWLHALTTKREESHRKECDLANENSAGSRGARYHSVCVFQPLAASTILFIYQSTICLNVTGTFTDGHFVCSCSCWKCSSSPACRGTTTAESQAWKWVAKDVNNLAWKFSPRAKPLKKLG